MHRERHADHSDDVAGSHLFAFCCPEISERAGVFCLVGIFPQLVNVLRVHASDIHFYTPSADFIFFFLLALVEGERESQDGCNRLWSVDEESISYYFCFFFSRFVLFSGAIQYDAKTELSGFSLFYILPL